MPQWLIKSEVTLNPEYDVNCSELNFFFTEQAVNEIFLLYLSCMCRVNVCVLYNTLKINTLPDICNYYLRLLGYINTAGESTIQLTNGIYFSHISAGE